MAPANSSVRVESQAGRPVTPPSTARAIILGPHPGNGMFSIGNYFNFCKDNFGRMIPDIRVGALAPGNGRDFDRAVLRESGRLTSWWQNYVAWPLQLRTLRAELFHIIDQGLGWYGEYLRGGRRLITVHDLIAYLNWIGKLRFETVSGLRVHLLKRSLEQIRKADHVVSVSRHTADCLVRDLKIPASKITVVHNFLSPGFYPLTDAERAEARQRWFASGEHVVIHVGKAFGYKNRLGALRAFALLRKRVPDAAMYLTSDPPGTEEVAFLAEAGIRQSVHFLAALSQPDLRKVYGAADALVFPSRYEGFGWPPLEAMACGCPVVSTTCASLAEVVGDAALTVPGPDDFPALANHLESILKNPSVASDLRQRGYERVNAFQPNRMLNQMGEVYRSLLRIG